MSYRDTFRTQRLVSVCRWILFFTLLIGWSHVASADPEQPRSVVAVHLVEGEHIKIDGHLEESVWQKAIPATGFMQREPNEGKPATEETVVYLIYDRDHLYIGVILYDSDVDGILAYQKQRDAPLYSDDQFAWIIDTFLDGRTGYFFEINPAGLMGDGLLGSGYRFGVNKSWDGIWDARVVKNEDGWSAEIRIPFRTLNFDPLQDTWGINFMRTIRRKNEETIWNGYRRNQGLTRPSNAGRVTGLRGMSQGVGLETTPYFLSGWSHMPEEENPTTYPRDIGFDFSYNITPGLRSAVSVNTDFAEVEVDQRRVNLTRFPLYYPEKRDFFLEGSSVFTFAGNRSMGFSQGPGSAVTPYFSRRIGLVEEEQIPVAFGGRLAGQAGRYELGVLQVRTGRHQTTPQEDFTVTRVKRSLFQQSYLGAIYTRRASEAIGDTAGPPDRHTFGADLDLFTSRFRGDKNLEFQTFLVWHTDPEVDGVSSLRDLSAHGIMINYPNDIWRGNLSYREFGKNFDPAIGFTRRNRFRRLQPVISFGPRPDNIAFIRQFRFQARFEYLTNLSNEIETQKTDLTLLSIRFESGDNVSLAVEDLLERLYEEFEVHPDIFIPKGDYRTVTWQLRGWTANYRIVSSNFRISRGGFWSGERTRYGISVTFRPYPGINLRTDFERNEVTLQEGNFSTHVFRLIGGWHINPWISITGDIQYDDVSELVGLFTKLRWIIRPGSELYMVYTHNWENMGDDPLERNFSTLSRGIATKINYTHRF